MTVATGVALVGIVNITLCFPGVRQTPQVVSAFSLFRLPLSAFAFLLPSSLLLWGTPWVAAATAVCYLPSI